MATKKTSEELKLMGEIIDCVSQSMTLREIATYLRRDISVVAALYRSAIAQNVSARSAHSKEFHREIAIIRIDRQLRQIAKDLDEMEGACSLKIRMQSEYRAYIKEWCLLHGLDREDVNDEELPPLLNIRVQQVELELPTDGL